MVVSCIDDIKFISFFSGILNISPEEKRQRLEVQARENKYHQFVDGELILKQGLVEKRKGLFARRRMLLLTTGPRLFYVDPVNMVLKGEIPWSPELRVEAKTFRIFLVHTVSFLDSYLNISPNLLYKVVPTLGSVNQNIKDDFFSFPAQPYIFLGGSTILCARVEERDRRGPHRHIRARYDLIGGRTGPESRQPGRAPASYRSPPSALLGYN